MTLGERLRSGSKWLVASSVTTYALNFATGIVLARLLAPEDFGMLVTINIFTGIAGYVSGAGMSQALVRAQEATDRDFHVVFTVQLLIGLLIYALFFVSAPWFASFFNTPLYATLLMVSSLTFIIRPFLNTPVARLQREMQFKKQAMIWFLPYVVAGVSDIVLALAGLKVWALIFGGMIGTFTHILLISYVTRWRPKIILDWRTARRHANSGFLITANNIVEHARVQMSNFIISRFLGPAAAGLYNKADSLSNLPADMLSKSTFQSVMRALAIVQTDPAQSRDIFFRAVTLILVYTLPCYVGLWWTGTAFITFVYGEQWVTAGQPLEILAWAGLSFALLSPAFAVLTAQNRLGQGLVIQMLALLVTMAAAFVGLRWGTSGIAWGIVASSSLLALAMTAYALRAIGGRWRELGRAIAPVLMLCALLFAALAAAHYGVLAPFAMPHPALYVCGMVAWGGLVYGGAFLFLPLAPLSDEALRWKKILRLTKNTSA